MKLQIPCTCIVHCTVSTQVIPSGLGKDVAQVTLAAQFQIYAPTVHRGLSKLISETTVWFLIVYKYGIIALG